MDNFGPSTSSAVEDIVTSTSNIDNDQQHVDKDTGVCSFILFL